MKVLIESTTGNALSTFAIGGQYYDAWYNYAYPSWKLYCEKYGLGLFVITEYMSTLPQEGRKNVIWEKWLVPDAVAKIRSEIKLLLYLDSDFLISPNAPDIFQLYKNDGSIGVVSQYRDMPYQDHEVRRRIAFHRNRYYSKDYPLDSGLFMSLEDLAEYHGTSVLTDYTCAGMFIISIAEHASLFGEWFQKYSVNVKSIDDDQYYFNYEVQKYGKLQWFDYKFQALWINEMAWKYPFLYNYGSKNKELIKQCIEASLLENYFLHFAGSWHECQMWKEVNIFSDPETLDYFNEYATYCKTPVTGKSKGPIKPRTDK